MPKPDSQTFISLLAYRAQETAKVVAYTYQNEPCTYAQIWQRLNQFAAYLQHLGLKRQDRVVMALPNGHDFFAAFYGTQRAGGIAVPVFPGYSPTRILTMVKLCGAKIVVLPSATPAEQLAYFKKQTASLGLTLITVAESTGMEAAAPFPEVVPDDLAFLQYTSGSTGNPKGVQLSHRNLLKNVNQMIVGMEITADDIFVSWLPVYHDMGLILKTMVPFYLAAQTHLLPTSLTQIHHWLEAIQHHRATFTAAPDFAYRLLLRRIQDPGAFDLSTLRVALNAAEPVRASTIREFNEVFGLNQVMVAGYGLAEATVGVSMWKPQTAVPVDARGFVSVGQPFPEVSITILKDSQPVPPHEIGDIAITSTANTSGYFNNPEATQTLYWHNGDNQTIPTTILSGDLGYLDEAGNLYIVGRKKNTIIQAGETIYAAEIEEIVNGETAVRYAAAVGIDDGRVEGERVTIFAEIRTAEDDTPDIFQDILIGIIQRFQDRFGFRPGAVYLLEPKTIPMTYNGKLQHEKLKQMFLQGELRQNGRILFPDY